MQSGIYRQSLIRLAAIVAIVIGLVISSGIAAADTRIGLRECMEDGCRVVTRSDLTRTTRSAQVVDPPPVSFPTDRFSPHLTR